MYFYIIYENYVIGYEKDFFINKLYNIINIKIWL